MVRRPKGKHIQPKASKGIPFISKRRSRNPEQAAGSEDQATIADNATVAVGNADEQPQAHIPAHAAIPGANNTVMLTADASGFQSATDQLESGRERRRKIGMRIGIASLITIGVLLAIYLAGALFFSFHFMPRTYIGNVDVSWKEPAEVQADFDAKVKDYRFNVNGEGLKLSITSKDAGMEIDSEAMTSSISASQNPWTWPAAFFSTRDVTHALTDAVSASGLSDIVKGAVEEVNLTAFAPQNARVEFVEEDKKFGVIPEVQGSQLEFDLVLEQIVLGAMNLATDVVVTEEARVKPTVYQDDKRLADLSTSANSLIRANITLVMKGINAAVIDASQISKWVIVDNESFASAINTEAMHDWAQTIADGFHTVGSTRTFTRHDGAVITVRGGDYGWAINTDLLADNITSAIQSGTVGTIDIPVLQSGYTFNGTGAQDWGNRYIDVDISEQHARFYDENGRIIWESDVITGTPTAERATPQGVWDLNSKGMNVTLTGRDSKTGEITYESKVKYWMPFKGNSVGFHDATWQSGFGGSRYRNGAGSHGCVNLPYSKAESLYSLIRQGDVVVVHE